MLWKVLLSDFHSCLQFPLNFSGFDSLSSMQKCQSRISEVPPLPAPHSGPLGWGGLDTAQHFMKILKDILEDLVLKGMLIPKRWNHLQWQLLRDVKARETCPSNREKELVSDTPWTSNWQWCPHSWCLLFVDVFQSAGQPPPYCYLAKVTSKASFSYLAGICAFPSKDRHCMTLP